MSPFYSFMKSIPLWVVALLLMGGESFCASPEKGKDKSPFAESNPTTLIKPITFKNLTGFKYEYPYEQPKGKPWELKEQFDKRVPEHVRKLNGKHISIRGFMLPVETKKDRVSAFLLMVDQASCCFGRVPEPNEWIVVEMVPKDGGPILMDTIIEIDGNLQVSEKWEDGFFVGIYHMDANRITKIKNVGPYNPNAEQK